MRIFLTTTAFALLFCTGVLAQSLQTNAFSHALNVNDSALNAVFLPVPIQFNTCTDSPLQVNISANANTPVLLLYAGADNVANTISANSLNVATVQIDLPDLGAPGYADQIVVDGFSGQPLSAMTNASGAYSLTTMFPACSFPTPGNQVCITQNSFGIAGQAVVVDASVQPFGVTSTGTVQGFFLNGYQEYPTSALSNDGSSTFTFKNGFTFNFYGVPYSFAYISENGFIQFGNTIGLNAFNDATAVMVNQGGPRIMSFLNDLVYTNSGNQKIFAQQFIENNVTKVRFVHRQVQEFGTATGGHGGTITITDNDEIAVFVAADNAQPSINTATGISKGGVSTSLFQHPVFNRDLTNDVDFGPTPLAANVPAFEVFDTTNPNPQNPMDLPGLYLFNGSDIGPGVQFVPNLFLPAGQFGYVVQ